MSITVGSVAAVATLLSKLAMDGMSIAAVFKQMRESGELPPDQIDAILAEVQAAHDAWHNAPGPGSAA